MKEIDIQSLARENIKRLKPYSSARDDFEGTASVFLDANENPFPTDFNRYPDPHQKELKKEIARLKNVKPEQIFLGNGSDEAIDLFFRVFCEPGKDSVLAPQPTYGMYTVSAEINNIKIISAQLTPAFQLDTDSLLKSVQPDTKLIFICSPNNPSANLINPKDIEVILNNFKGIVIIDEAYIDFSESPSWTTRISEFKNLAILQTFSKAWGLAGLRVGMCFANEEIIRLLNKIKPPYNINAFSQSETLRCITSRKEGQIKMVTEIKTSREELKKQLGTIKSVKKIFPSDANFLLVEVDDARSMYSKLIDKGIVVRDRSNVILCDNCLRITVGTKEENKQLTQAISLL
ncbi:MAG: histidinol-phosphate transaminase [Cyclobacteriaceae bacterium]|nr:histidinol-phosphate transaminase [Cyclobacteriaceae bacterium]